MGDAYDLVVVAWYIGNRVIGASAANMMGRGWVNNCQGGCIEFFFLTVVSSMLVNRVERSMGCIPVVRPFAWRQLGAMVCEYLQLLPLLQ